MSWCWLIGHKWGTGSVRKYCLRKGCECRKDLMVDEMAYINQHRPLMKWKKFNSK